MEFLQVAFDAHLLGFKEHSSISVKKSKIDEQSPILLKYLLQTSCF